MPWQIESTPDASSWEPQPQAVALLQHFVNTFMEHCPDATRLAQLIHQTTATRFLEWIDHITLPVSSQIEEELVDAGFLMQELGENSWCFAHDGGVFPRVLLAHGVRTQVTIKVESIADFLAACQISPLAPVEGPPLAPPLAPLRRARVYAEKGAELWIVERHGYQGFSQLAWCPTMAGKAMQHWELLRLRQRAFADDEDGFKQAGHLVEAARKDLGPGYACDLFFAAEREYWQHRNHAAQIQKSRQDTLGLGWANHDHHAYRSSRQCFAFLIAFLERLGFLCRQRFYAGPQAGWGTQVLQHPQAGIIISADVDLSPIEATTDFAHHHLPPLPKLGDIGLWCALHGQSFLQAGLHHLGCQFDFDALRQQMDQQEGLAILTPSTNLAHLRQAYTQGERWTVKPDRIDPLLQQGQITPEQAEEFLDQGAVGSHLEALERNSGL